MAISKAEWQQIEDELKSFYGEVIFKYQSCDITVARCTTGEGKRDLMVYIDGTANFSWGYPKGQYMDGEHFRPIVQSIWRKRSRSYYPPKQQKEIIKIWGKRRAKKEYPYLEKKYEWYDPLFTTAKSLVSQFKKLEGLQLVPKEEFVEGGA